jgi:hypothetical protein
MVKHALVDTPHRITGQTGNFSDRRAGAGVFGLLCRGLHGGEFSEFLTLENPDPTSTAYVLVKYLPATGGAPALRVYAVPAHSRATVYTNAVLPGQAFSMVVQSGMPIVAERPMYFIFNGTQTGGSDVVGYQP